MPNSDALTFLTLGFLLGARHALDADHIAAVTTILCRAPRLATSGLIGLAWGVGHGLTVVGVGLLLIAFGVTLPPRFAQALEFAVGLMLVALGVSLGGRVIRGEWHAHGHEHEGTRHWHLHRHEKSTLHEHHHEHWMQRSLRPLLVGSCHGLAGTASLALVAASSAASVGGAVLFLAAFGLGSVLGMMLTAFAISVPLVLSAAVGQRAHRVLQAVASLGSIGLGVAIMAEILLGSRLI